MRGSCPLLYVKNSSIVKRQTAMLIDVLCGKLTEVQRRVRVGYSVENMCTIGSSAAYTENDIDCTYRSRYNGVTIKKISRRDDQP